MNVLKNVRWVFQDLELPKYHMGSAPHVFEHEGKRYHLERPRSDFYRRIFARDLSPENVAHQRAFLAHFPRLDTYVDIGANLGYYAVATTAARSFERTLLFEPSKFNFRYLQKNAGAIPGVRLFNLGLSNEEGTGQLAMPLSRYRNWFKKLNNTGILSLHGNGRYRREQVRLDTLDKLEAREGFEVDNAFIKMDIEGHEYFALLGMKNALRRNNVFNVEVNPNVGQQHAADLFALFASNGYAAHQYYAAKDSLPPTSLAAIGQETTDVTFMKTASGGAA